MELVDPKATVLHGRLENNCNYLVQCPGSIARKLRADMFLVSWRSTDSFPTHSMSAPVYPSVSLAILSRSNGL